MLNRIIRFFLENKVVTMLLLLLFIGWGLMTAPFNWSLGGILPRDPVSVDAIPNLGENQQIVYTRWAGRSPKDIQDQITYPLTTALLGVPGVKEIRSSSMFGFSSIYVIFEEDVEFYWSRSRILEKLNSLPSGLLPEGVQPSLGPDATALGQIFWYTLEGRSPDGEPVGGWSLQELRTIQDYYVRYGLASVKGVAEVASVGGYVKEYQVDVKPSAMKAHNIQMDQVMKAVRNSNLDVGANTMEVNKVEYLVRGLGYIKNKKDLEQAVVATRNHTPITIQDIAEVKLGPADRRGILDKGGTEAVGGVVVAREGANPMKTIERVKAKIKDIKGGLPSKTLDDGTKSKVTVVPFYDRSGLIQETIGTLEEALTLEVLITILVIILMVLHLRASLLISGLLPVAVLLCFVAMKYTGVEANIVALSGIAIAIGTMVDLGIILSENMLQHLDKEKEGESRLETIYNAAAEVAPAILTAIATTVISFIPVFTLQQEEGRLFRPLAYTKTYALIAALLVSLIIIPALAHLFLGKSSTKSKWGTAGNILLLFGGFVIALVKMPWAGVVLMVLGATNLAPRFLPESYHKYAQWVQYGFIALAVVWLLAGEWLPLGPSASMVSNGFFVALLVGGLLGFFTVVIRYYQPVLSWCLEFKKMFIALPALIVLTGLMIWLGFSTIFAPVAKGFDGLGWNIRQTAVWSKMHHAFPGTGKEFMPDLDEGSYLLMPTTTAHAGVEKTKELLQRLDKSVASIPEVKSVVGKAGRVESALDPAPLSMFENVIKYKNEFVLDEDGGRMRFAVKEDSLFLRKDTLKPVKAGRDIDPENLVPDPNGQYYRQWRDHIESPDDIWQEIVDASKFPSLTSAPKLQPIETRQVMLQSGMRAPMGIKIKGDNLQKIEDFGFTLEKLMKEVPSVKEEAVYAERIVGKPYIQLDLKRDQLARYGLSIKNVQRILETAVGGKVLTKTVEGRERYPVRVRYPREYRDDPDKLRKILIPTSDGEEIPLEKIADITYERGPKVIKSENTFLTGYVLFDKEEGYASGEVVQAVKDRFEKAKAQGELEVPEGISYEFAGDYKSQQRAEKRLALVIPLVLVLIFFLIYLQFRSVPAATMIFTAIIVAFSGGFLMLWLYGQDWFMHFSLFGKPVREIFQIQTIHLSVAVWVGFIALFGIATDDGVVMTTYLHQSFERNKPKTIKEIRQAVVEAGSKRVRPCLMTTATTLLALLPVISSTGKGSNIMVPMAIPVFGGMAIEVITLFVVPVLYGWHQEKTLNRDL